MDKEYGKKYLRDQARKALASGFRWDGVFHDDDYDSVRIYLTGPTFFEGTFQSLFLPEEHRGQGRFKALLDKVDLPIATMTYCDLIPYFHHHDMLTYVAVDDYRLVGLEYDLISEFYEGKRAKRSGVPYMNHIDEGLGILNEIKASPLAMRAYCLHPLLQMDNDLRENEVRMHSIHPYVTLRAMEYRNIANAYLSHREIDSIDEIALSPIKDVNDMLIADKVQNYKDFLKYHDGTHPRSAELHAYFHNWFERLEVDYSQLSKVLAPF